MATNSYDVLNQTLQLFHQEILALQSDLKDLAMEVSGLKSGCNAKHRINLTEEIAHLETHITNNSTNICQFETKLNELNTTINEINRTFKYFNNKI
jgi:predicted RNase H-like nuclease (RuvC/YqgF family)